MGARGLPSPDAPLLSADGEPILPTAAKSFGRVEVPSSIEAKRLVSTTRRKLMDMPALPQHMNAYAAALVYTISGLSDSEISLAMKLDVAQIKRLREQPAYRQIEEYIIQAVKEQTAAQVTDILAQHEVKAAEKIGALVENMDPKIALAASKDVLDRRGHVPKQVIDLRTQMQNTFRIEVVDKRGVEKPVIDMEIEDA